MMDGAKLESVPLFATLSVADRQRLADRMQEVDAEEDSYLVERGELSYKFFVILEGTAKVEQRGRDVGELGPGDFFGEAGVVSHERRNADVIANSHMRLAVLIGWDVRSMMEEFPRVRAKIEDTIDQRTEG